MKKEAEPGGTVGKALSVLEVVARHDRPLKFNEILEESKYPKPTVFRLAQTLVNQNLLKYNKGSGTYTLGVSLITLAHAAWKTASLAPIARQHVLDLAQKVKEAVHLAQLDNGQVIFVDKILSTNQYETLARIEYSEQERKIFLTKLSIPEEIQDKEFEEAFIFKVLEFIQDRNLRFVPTSPQIASFVRRNRRYKELLPVGIKL